MNIRKIINEVVGKDKYSLTESDFGWIEKVEPFNINDCKWIIETTNHEEWVEVEQFMFDNGWIWGDAEEGEQIHSDYEGEFHFFFPDDHSECDNQVFDAGNKNYFYNHDGELNSNFRGHKFIKWSNVRNLLLKEDSSLDWVGNVEPYEIGDYFLDWDGQKCWVSDITNNEIEIGTYDDGEDDPSYYRYEKDDVDQYFKSGEFKVINESNDFGWAEDWIDTTPTVGKEYHMDYDMDYDPVLIKVYDIVDSEWVKFEVLDKDFVDAHEEMFYDMEDGWDYTDSISLEGFMDSTKPVEGSSLKESEFDWTVDVPDYEVKKGDVYTVPNTKTDFSIEVINIFGYPERTCRLKIFGGVIDEEGIVTDLPMDGVVDKLNRGFWVKRFIR